MVKSRERTNNIFCKLTSIFVSDQMRIKLLTLGNFIHHPTTTETATTSSSNNEKHLIFNISPYGER